MIHHRELAGHEFRPISLRRVLQPFAGRLPLLAAAMLLPAMIVWTASGRLPPTYRATALILLEQDEVQIGKIADMMKAPILTDSATISNEIAIILSTPVLQGAAHRLGLLDATGMPLAAAGALSEAGQGWARPVRDMLHRVGLPRAAELALPSPTRRLQDSARVTDRLRQGLDVTRNLNAYVVEVVARASDPMSAAAIANAVVEEYIARQARVKREVADRALDWMNGEIGDLRRRIAELNHRAQAERRTMLGAEAADPATTENQLRAVGSALALARAERADAEARLGQLRASFDRLGAAAAGELIETPEIVALRRQLADLKQRLAAERAARGDSRPLVSELQAQVASLSDFAEQLVAKELDRLDLDLRIRSERVEALQRESRKLQQDALNLEQARFAVADIEREAAANQELYVVLLTRLNEITAQKESIAPDAHVLNAAVPPEEAAGPQRGLLALLAGVIGLFGFTASVLAVDALSGRFESLGELEEATGLTVLGAVERRPGDAPSQRMIDRDIGILPGEDGIELAVMLRGTGPLPRIVVLLPTASVIEAEALALRLIASADRRDRSVQVISLETEPSRDGANGLFQTMPLSVHLAVEQDAGASASAQIRQAFPHCDAVVLILPPVAETAMIVAWARVADSTLVVVDGRRPGRVACLRTVARLREAGVVPAGVVAVG